jgi:hypothetical protein
MTRDEDPFSDPSQFPLSENDKSNGKAERKTPRKPSEYGKGTGPVKGTRFSGNGGKHRKPPKGGKK